MKRWKHSYKHVVINTRNAEELEKVGEERNVIKTTKRRKANWIGHFLRRNCLLKHVIEGKNRLKGRSDGKTRKKK
jgi:hypothetical protein